MKRIVWAIILVNTFGLTTAVLALLGLISPPLIVVPFVLTPSLISPFYRILTDPRHRVLAVATIATMSAAIVTFVYILFRSFA